MNFWEFCKEHSWKWLLPVLLLCAIYAPVYPQVFREWMSNPNYSHGILVPAVSGWFIWRMWPELKNSVVKPTNVGFILLVAGILCLGFGLAIREFFTTRCSLIIILMGLVHVFFGTRVLRLLALPLIFLFFMVPLPATVYDMLTLPLKSLVSALATSGMKVCGIPVLREGNIIMLPNISLEVVEACSGMRSLVSLMALGTAYAFIFLQGTWQKAVLIAATVPIAVLTNVSRVFITGVLARQFGAGVAEGFFHDFAGFMVFFVAMILTAATGGLLAMLPFGRKGDGHAD